MKKDIYNNLLLKRFPTLVETEEYKSNVFDLDTPAHSFYERIFVPYIINKIKNDDEKEIDRCFSFIEELITCDEEMANELAMNSILMPLQENKEINLSQLPLRENSLKYYKLWLK